MTPLTESYRPKALKDVVGQDAAVKRLEFLAARGLGGRAFWISGLSGTGKTTIARIIASQVAGDWAEEMDASCCTPKTITEWEQRTRCRPLDQSGHCLIINEAHGLRKDTVRQFLVFLERLKPYCTVIFTTTLAGQMSLFDGCDDAGPLTSRCVVFQLESRGSSLELPFALHLRDVAKREGIDGVDLSRYISLVRTNGHNLRACLNGIESGVLLA